MQRIWSLIKLDIITMNGGKNNMRLTFVLMFLICGGFGFVFSPVFGLYMPLIMGGLFVPMLFQNEIKYHSEKLHTLLPISRKDLVNARFLFVTVLYTVMFVIVYFIMMLAQHLQLSYLIIGEEAEMVDIIGLLVRRSNGAFTELGLFNLLYFTAYAFGLIYSCGTLKKYFRNSESVSAGLSLGKITKAQKGEYLFGAVIVAIVILMFLVLTGAIPLGVVTSFLMPFMALFVQLVQAADGFVLAASMICVALFAAVYNYVGALLEYEEKEL